MKHILPTDYNKLKTYERRQVREQYVEEQNGLCYYCSNTLTDEPPQKVLNKKINWSLFPNGFRNYPVHLQHNHNTGMTEGAVHNYCNAVMWQYENR